MKLKKFSIIGLVVGALAILAEFLYIIKPTLFPDWYTEGGAVVSLAIIVLWLVFGAFVLVIKNKQK